MPSPLIILLADAVNVKRMVEWPEVIELAGCVYYVMYPWVTKLYYLT